MDFRYVVAALALTVAAASLLVTAYALLQMVELGRRLSELSETLREVERVKQQLQERVRELEEALRRESGGGAQPLWDVRAIVYILPSRACSSEWRERYGDRIYFYVYANLSEYHSLIEEDFRLLALVYNTVIMVVPADDTELYFSNLKLIDELASENGLRIMWVVLPKWKYGAEHEYLVPGSRMNRLVLGVMDYLSKLNSTWRIAVWYGWRDRANALDIIRFYESLPYRLKPLYAAWIDQPFIKAAVDLAEHDPPFLVVTELYSEDALRAFSNLLPNQMVITGFYGARTPQAWLEGISRKIQLIGGADRVVGIWIFYDIGDGHGEEYAAYRPEWRAVPDPYRMQIVTLPGSP